MSHQALRAVFNYLHYCNEDTVVEVLEIQYVGHQFDTSVKGIEVSVKRYSHVRYSRHPDLQMTGYNDI